MSVTRFTHVLDSVFTGLWLYV